MSIDPTVGFPACLSTKAPEDLSSFGAELFWVDDAEGEHPNENLSDLS